jgi:hypothetical protein
MPVETTYLLTNPAMPGLIKIGITTNDDVQVRMAQLYTTGVPVPFECAYAATVNDAPKVEQALHNAFSPHRLNPRREFFDIEVGQAIGIIKLIEIENVTPKVNSSSTTISEVEREAGEQLSKKRPKMNYAQMGIPIGSEIICRSTGESATIASERTIRYKDEEMSLTAATRMALSNDYNIAPAPYWTFNGVSLQEIYDSTYLRGD